MFSSAFSRSRSSLAIVIVVALLVPVALAQASGPAVTGTNPPEAAGSPDNSAPHSAPPSGHDSAINDSAINDTAQEPSASDQAGMFVFKKEVEEVMLHATVFDEQPHIVPDLNRAAFSVLENGTPRTITSFRRQDVPVAMGIVIDNSGSMRDKRDEVRPSGSEPCSRQQSAG